jgi:hypothetical protein
MSNTFYNFFEGKQKPRHLFPSIFLCRVFLAVSLREEQKEHRKMFSKTKPLSHLKLKTAQKIGDRRVDKLVDSTTSLCFCFYVFFGLRCPLMRVVFRESESGSGSYFLVLLMSDERPLPASRGSLLRGVRNSEKRKDSVWRGGGYGL